MENGQFDRWVKDLASGKSSRRTALTAVCSAALGGLAASLSLTAEAKRRRKKRKKKNVAFNSFGCVDVGKFCKNDEQCCSGICEGKKDRKTCQAHDTGGCQADQDICADTGDEECPQAEGLCFRTTGNASFCAEPGEGGCAACARDVDCEAEFGPGAACVACLGCEVEMDTACLPPVKSS